MAVASLVFYAWGETTAVYVVLISIAGNYLAAWMIDSRRGERSGRWILGGSVALNVLAIGYYKYAAFAADVLQRLHILSAEPRLAVIHLPLGISFFTFHAISYLVDIHRGSAKAQRNPLVFALYILFFPQLIAGPIVRYKIIAPQFEDRAVRMDDVAEGLRRLILGLVRKVWLADTLAPLADFAFDAGFRLSPADALIGVAAYALQLYYDFSGYSDMAIGLARIFGFRFPENFNFPYSADSIRDFWRRWHMTLSAFFRDYVYVPLGGNRQGTWRTAFNLGAVFVLTGIWHGAGYTFLAWGLYHGVFISVEKAVGEHPAFRGWFGRAYALGVVWIGWIIFRAHSPAAAGRVLAALLSFSGNPKGYVLSVTPLEWAALATGLLCSQDWFMSTGGRLLGGVRSRAPYPWVRDACLLAVLAMTVVLVESSTYSPFIYFRF